MLPLQNMHPVGTRRRNDVDFWLKSGRHVTRRDNDVDRTSFRGRCEDVDKRRCFDVEFRSHLSSVGTQHQYHVFISTHISVMTLPAKAASVRRCYFGCKVSDRL